MVRHHFRPSNFLVVIATLSLVCAGCQYFRLRPPPAPPAVPPAVEASPVAADYAVCFPDVIELKVAGQPEHSGRRLVYPDGRLDLGSEGQVFAEGCTTKELSQRIAERVGVPAEQVQCQVSSARSRAIYLVGTGIQQPRALAYRGPEGVTQLLQRTGGLPATNELQVRVVRRNVARGTETETFRVDLPAIRRGDMRTDVVLQPNDEIHLSEDSGIRLATFIPDWIQ
ncbi:MAG TPA: polysaccharide biosynthesis/export family protein [Gemmataceae bacterium]|nr:polysaccharide biosynthesis/export family protein [Gemmataceae bacterium]